MPKLSADQTQTTEIIRVEITPQMLNETNEDGSYKFDDAQLNDWLTKLRGDREMVLARKASKDSSPKAPKVTKSLTEDDLT